MNTRYIFSIILGLLSLTAYSADNYYYYCGNKVPLTVERSYVVAISPVNSPVNMPAAYTLSDSINIEDDRSNIKVYKFGSLAQGSKLLPQNVYECYKSLGNGPLIPNGYINIELKQESDIKLLNSLADEYEFTIVRQSKSMPLWYTIHVLPQSNKSSIDIANRLYETKLFSACSPSFSFDAREVSYDPNVIDQWNLYNSDYEDVDINISKAWSYATGRGIKVAVLDEGIDLQHIDLHDNISSLSYDTETSQTGSKVYGSHGTHCAGIIGAMRNNGIQITGVAPDVTLVSISNELYLTTDESIKLADGIEWAWKNGADIISCSWYCIENEAVQKALENAITKGRNGKGCIIVKSAGNRGNGDGKITYPGGAHEGIITVANIKKDGIRASSSSFGQELFISAPGSDILSTVPNNEVGRKSGTSMACPHVAGVVALILERNPSLTNYQVREILAKSANKIGDIPYNSKKQFGPWNMYYGYGMVDAYKAIMLTPRIK